jgi:cell division protein FtsB
LVEKIFNIWYNVLSLKHAGKTIMQQKAQIFKIITVAMIVFIVILSVAMIINLVKLAKVRAHAEELNALEAAATAKLEAGAEEIEYKQTAEYITRYAREKLGLMAEGETAFTGKKEG